MMVKFGIVVEAKSELLMNLGYVSSKEAEVRGLVNLVQLEHWMGDNLLCHKIGCFLDFGPTETIGSD